MLRRRAHASDVRRRGPLACREGYGPTGSPLGHVSSHLATHGYAVAALEHSEVVAPELAPALPPAVRGDPAAVEDTEAVTRLGILCGSQRSR